MLKDSCNNNVNTKFFFFLVFLAHVTHKSDHRTMPPVKLCL